MSLGIRKTGLSLSHLRIANPNNVIGAAALLLTASLSAQTTVPSADRLPPPGIAIPAPDRDELTTGASNLRKEIDSLEKKLQANPKLAALLPDVEIFHKAVDWALRYDEFFDLKQVGFAKTMLQQGHERAAQLGAGQAPWLDATGLVVRGYRSKVDGSVQVQHDCVVRACFSKRTGGLSGVTQAGRRNRVAPLRAVLQRHEIRG